MADNRKYFAAVMILFGAIVLLAVAFVGLVFWAMTQRLGGGSQIGAAKLFVPGPVAPRYSVAGTFDLPKSPDILHSEPSLQFEFTGSGPQFERYSVGLARAEKNGDRVSGFVYYKVGNQPAQQQYFAPIPDGPHRVAIAFEASRIRFSIDGKTAMDVRDPGIVKMRTSYFTAGTDVGVRGEHAVGTISNLTIQKAPGQAPQELLPTCAVTTHGLSLTRTGQSWRVSGINDPAARAVVRGCHDAAYPPGALTNPL